MKKHILTLLCMAVAPVLLAQSINDFTIPKKTSSSGPFTPKTIPGGSNALWGTGSGGDPAKYTPASGILTLLQTPSSSNLRAALTDETGTGVAVFGTSPTIATPTITGAISFEDGVKQLFNPNGTNAGINVGSHTADPSSLSNGDLFYNSSTNKLKARINGDTVELGLPNIASDISGGTITFGGVLSGPVVLYVPSADGTIATTNDLEGFLVTNNLAANMYPWLIDPTSAKLAATLTNETGSGNLVFSDSASLYAPTITGVISLEDGVRQTFNPNGTNAGINVGSHSSDPSSLSNGDLFYNTSTNKLKARINGATVELGAGGGGGTGDVVGPASSTDNAISLFDGATGKLLKVSEATITTGGNISTPGGITTTGGYVYAEGGGDNRTTGIFSDGLQLNINVGMGATAVTVSAHPSTTDWNLVLPQDGGSNGEVLVTDGAGNSDWAPAMPNVTVSVHKNGTDQSSVGNNAWTTISFGTEVSDPDGDFASNTLTVASGEVWEVTCVVTINTATNATPARLAIYKDGSEYRIPSSIGSYATPVTMSCCETLQEAGAYTFRVYSNNGVPLTVEGTASETYLIARRLK